MKKWIAAVGAVLLITAAGITCGAGMGHKVPERSTAYTEHYAVIMAGETLWQKCQKYAGKEDIQDLVERVRLDNNIKNPGSIQPGQKILIREKN